MSPRRFDRRTYMIVAPGWSALAFKAAMSASSASTTIRSAFPFTLSPTVNCHDILAFLKATLRTSAHPIARYLACERSISFVRGGCRVAGGCRGALSAHPYMHKNRERGGRWFKGHHMLHGPAPRALHISALVNNGARSSQMAIQSPQHKGPRSRSRTNLKPDCLGRAVSKFGLRLPQAECLLGFPEREMSAVGT